MRLQQIFNVFRWIIVFLIPQFLSKKIVINSIFKSYYKSILFLINTKRVKKIYHLFITLFFLIIYRLGSFSKITFGDAAGKILDIEQNQFTYETY